MNIVYFSPIAWDDFKQRPQYIAEGLSKEHRVYFIEPSLSIINCLKNRSKNYNYREFDINQNLKVIRPSGKFRFPKSIENIDILNLNTIYDMYQLKNIISDSDIIWFGSPVYYSILNWTRHKKIIIYDKMDDYDKLTTNRYLANVILKNEKRLICKSNLIFTTCKVFYNRLKIINDNTFLINNGFDINFNNEQICENEITKHIDNIKESGSKIFGYIGTIDIWFDFEAIKAIIDCDKNCNIVLVGKNNISKFQHKNVHYIDSVKKDILPSIINKFDYCLYTFKRDDFLNTIDPVKMYEYLGMNKTVIAVESQETLRFKEHIILYKNLNDIKNILLNDKIYNYKPFSTEQDLRGFTLNNSWEERIKSILDILNSKYKKY